MHGSRCEDLHELEPGLRGLYREPGLPVEAEQSNKFVQLYGKNGDGMMTATTVNRHHFIFSHAQLRKFHHQINSIN